MSQENKKDKKKFNKNEKAQNYSKEKKDNSYKWEPESKNLDYVFNKEYYERSIFNQIGCNKDIKNSVDCYKYLEDNEDNLKNDFDNAHYQIIELSKKYTQDYKKLWLYNLEAQKEKQDTKVDKNNIDKKDIKKFEIESFSLKVNYPGLVIGIGNPHGTNLKGDIQIGMSFDYVTGLPFVSGSSIKGKLRSIMEKLIDDEYEAQDNLNPKKNEKNDDGIIKISLSDYLTIDTSNPTKKLTKNQIQEFVNIIFEGLEFKTDENGNIVLIEDKVVEKEIPILNRDIFYGGIVIPKQGKAFLKEDFLAPHSSKIKSPNVLKFLAISPDTEIKFYFSLKDSILVSENEKITITSTQKKDLFEKLLKDFGVGAKTNVGYGIME